MKRNLQTKSRAQQHIRETTQQKLRRHKIMFCCLVHWVRSVMALLLLLPPPLLPLQLPPTTIPCLVVKISCIRKVCIINEYQTIRNWKFVSSLRFLSFLPATTTTSMAIFWIVLALHVQTHICRCNAPNQAHHFVATESPEEILREFSSFFPPISLTSFANGLSSAFAVCVICFLGSTALPPCRSTTATIYPHALTMLVCAFAISLRYNTWGMKGSFIPYLNVLYFFVRSFACALCVCIRCERSERKLFACFKCDVVRLSLR